MRRSTTCGAQRAHIDTARMWPCARRSRRESAVCNLCEAICGLELTLDGGRVTGVRGNPDDPLSRGHICPKGVAIGRHPRRPRPVAPAGTPAARATHVGRDRLGRGLRPGRRRPGRAPSTSTAATRVGIYLGNPNVHSLGSITHGTAMVKSLRHPQPLQRHLRRPAPPPAGRAADVRPPAVPADPRHRPHVVLPGLRRQPDGLQRLADDRARLPATGCATLKARGGRMVVFDPRRTETAKVANEHHFVRPGSDAFVLLAMLQRAVRRRAWPPRRRTSTGWTPSRPPSPRSPPSAPRRHSGVAGRRDPPAGPRVRGRGRRRRLRPGRRLRPTSSARCASGRSTCSTSSPATSTAAAARCSPTPPIDAVGTGLIGRGHHDLWRSRVRGLPESAGELPVAALREEIETPGEGQIRAMLTARRQPGALHPRRRPARRARWPASTSWPRSTSTSTRPPGTPT